MIHQTTYASLSYQIRPFLFINFINIFSNQTGQKNSTIIMKMGYIEFCSRRSSYDCVFGSILSTRYISITTQMKPIIIYIINTFSLIIAYYFLNYTTISVFCLICNLVSVFSQICVQFIQFTYPLCVASYSPIIIIF